MRGEGGVEPFSAFLGAISAYEEKPSRIKDIRGVFAARGVDIRKLFAYLLRWILSRLVSRAEKLWPRRGRRV